MEEGRLARRGLHSTAGRGKEEGRGGGGSTTTAGRGNEEGRGGGGSTATTGRGKEEGRGRGGKGGGKPRPRSSSPKESKPVKVSCQTNDNRFTLIKCVNYCGCENH